MDNVLITSPELARKQREQMLKENPRFAISIKQMFPEDDLIKKYLQNPNLLDLIIKELDKKIVGEEITRKVILLVANGKNVENPAEKASYNLMVNAQSGAGKDYVTSNTLKILPKEETIVRKRITPKVFAYWKPKDETWDKKVFYCEDIPNAVLNEDVFKVMASSGNSISTMIINQKLVEVEIKGKPVMIITIAEANPKNENLRRFPIVDVNESANQTKEIMKRQSYFAKTGESLDYNPEITKALAELKRVKVSIPFAEKIDKHFPTEHIILRTNYPRFLDYIKSSCSLHQYQREQDERGYYLATKQDYEIARICLSKSISSKNLIPITSNQKKILVEIRKLNNPNHFSVSDIFPKITFMSERGLRNNLDNLSKDKLFLDRDYEKVEGVSKPVMFYNLIKSPDFKIPSYDEITSNNTSTTFTSNTSNTSNRVVNEVNEVNATEIETLNIKNLNKTEEIS